VANKGKLTAATIAAAMKASEAPDYPRHGALISDGNSLYLLVRKGLKPLWVFRWHQDGRRNSLYIGAWDEVSIDAARKAATAARAKADDKLLELPKRRHALHAAGAQVAAAPGTSFSEVMGRYISKQLAERRWSNPADAERLPRQLKEATRTIAQKSVTEITTRDVAAVMMQPWDYKGETRPLWQGPKSNGPGTRLLSLIRGVFSYAKAEEVLKGDNPAAWEQQKQLLVNSAPDDPDEGENHHDAVPVADLPRLYAEAPDVLRFIILTAARRGEVIYGGKPLMWDEIDLENRVCRLPASRMKTRVPHTVALSDEAVSILERQPTRTGPVFVNAPPKHTLARLVKRFGGTIHGLRSTFKQWADDAGYADELSELALSHHGKGNKVKEAYKKAKDPKADLIKTQKVEQRRPMMAAWAAYATGAA
jgi:integrase